MRYVIVGLIALVFITRYCLPTQGISRVQLTGRSRYEYVKQHRKDALDVVMYFNAATLAGMEEPGLRVYGLWLEDLRSYATEFELVGSIFGYADHRDMFDAMSDETGSPGLGLYLWLLHYDIDYLVYDDRRSQDVLTHFPDAMLPDPAGDWMYLDMYWDSFFEEFEIAEWPRNIHVWKVR